MTCRIGGPCFAPGLDDELVQRERAGEGAEDTEDPSLGRQVEDLARLGLRNGPRARRDRPADDAHLRAEARRDRVREEEPAGERRREAVREAEVCVRLAERGGDAHRCGCEDHRAGDVAAAAEHHVGASRAKDPPARAWSRAGEQQRAGERKRRLPRQAGDPERVELEAGFRNQLSFDAIRRPGECHLHAAGPKCFRDGECRQHVSGRSPGGDQAPQLPLGFHAERC